MGRLNPWDDQFKRPAERTEQRELRDPALSAPFTLTLRQPDQFVRGLMQDRAQEYIGNYVASGKPLAAPDGQVIPLSRTLCADIAGLEVMQVPEPGERPYSLMDWIGIAAKFPQLFEAAVQFKDELYVQSFMPQRAVEGGEGNPSGPPTTSS